VVQAVTFYAGSFTPVNAQQVLMPSERIERRNVRRYLSALNSHIHRKQELANMGLAPVAIAGSRTGRRIWYDANMVSVGCSKHAACGA
jgi:5-enolpyruvylshikimate-3-phosphate synthase